MNEDKVYVAPRGQDVVIALMSPGKPLVSPSSQPRVAADTTCASTLETDLTINNPPNGQSFDDAGTTSQSSNTTVLDVEPVPKYRLNKSSFSRDLRLSNTHDEPSLHEILTQERNAWLEDVEARRQVPLDKYGPAQDADVLHHNDDDRGRTPSTCNLQRRQRSCFQEGSMNESSKGIASTWLGLSSAGSDDHDYDSQLSDMDTTPRASAASRASTCSSIDINEFKPLPATPSTFKATIKRFGHKVANSKPANNVEHPAIHPRAGTKVKKGLRKSISSWKIFNSSTSDCEGDSVSSIHNEILDPKKAKTSKRTQQTNSQFDRALSQKAIFDERKRKAEIAYSQQFGTVRKRAKISETCDDLGTGPSERDDFAQVTVRNQNYLVSSIDRTVRSRSHEPDACGSVLSTNESHIQGFSVLPAQGKHTSFLRHTRARSHDSARSSESKTDCLKKKSRSELEKENQRLRLMLKGTGTKTTIRERFGDSRAWSVLDTVAGNKQMAEESVLHKQDGWTSHETTPLARFPPDLDDNGNPPNMEGSQKLSTRPEYGTGPNNDPNVPPMPPLPTNAQQRDPLSVASGNIGRLRETATMKRRAPDFNTTPQAGLPRPLSMVLEGIENESDEDHRVAKCTVNLNGAVGEENVLHRQQPAMNESNYQHVDRSHWAWPEDVF